MSRIFFLAMLLGGLATSHVAHGCSCENLASSSKATLSCEGENATEVQDLTECAPAIRTLRFLNSKVTSLEPLKGTKFGNLEGFSWKSENPVAGLPEFITHNANRLMWLNLGGKGIENIGFLKELEFPMLSSFSLEDSAVSDVCPVLENVASAKRVITLQGNAIQSIKCKDPKPIDVRRLFVLSNKMLTDISSLKGFLDNGEVEAVRLIGNHKLEDLDALEGLRSPMETLDVTNNAIRSLEVLNTMALPKLRYLHANSNALHNLAGIEGLPGLHVISASNNYIRSIPDLREFSDLTTIDLRKNPLTAETFNTHYLPAGMKIPSFEEDQAIEKAFSDGVDHIEKENNFSVPVETREEILGYVRTGKRIWKEGPL